MPRFLGKLLNGSTDDTHIWQSGALSHKRGVLAQRSWAITAEFIERLRLPKFSLHIRLSPRERQKPSTRSFSFDLQTSQLSACVTKTLLLLSSTTGPACAKPASPVTMLPEPCFPPSWGAPDIRYLLVLIFAFESDVDVCL